MSKSKENQNTIELKNNKKIKIIACLIALFVLITGVVIAVRKANKTPTPTPTPTPSRKLPIEEEVIERIEKIDDSDSNETKQQAEKNQEQKENREKSSDVTIPEEGEASEEEINKAQNKHDYLKILEEIERIYQKKHTPISQATSSNFCSSIYSVNDIVIEESTNELYAVVTTVNCYNGKYFYSEQFLDLGELPNKSYYETWTREEIISHLSSQKKFNSLISLHSFDNNEIANKIINDAKILAPNLFSGDIVATSLKYEQTSEPNEYRPSGAYCLIKYDASYEYVEYGINSIVKDIPTAEVEDYIMKNTLKPRRLSSTTFNEITSLKFDYLKKDYESQTEA